MFNYLSQQNFIFCSVELIQVLGLDCAVYVTELINQSETVINDDNFFTPDRNKIELRLGFSFDKQLDLDDKLLSLNIIKRKQQRLSLDENSFLQSLNTLKKGEKAEIKKVVKTTKSELKVRALKNRLRTKIATTNVELRDAYSSWIDAVLLRYGWMTDAAIISAQKTLDDFTKRDLDLALEILNIAAINGWKDIQWAINKYNDMKANKTNLNNIQIKNTNNQPIVLSEEVF